LKEQSNSLEKIIEFLMTQNSEALEKDNCNYIATAVCISAEVQRLLELVSTHLENNNTEFTVDISLPMPIVIVTVSPEDVVDGGYAPRTENSRKVGGLMRAGALSKSSSNLTDATQNVTTAYVNGELVSSRSMENILDYDMPIIRNVQQNSSPMINPATLHMPINQNIKQESNVMIIPATLRENRNITLLKHNADVRSFDVEKEKRGAVVMDKGEHQFDILVRRYADSKMAPSVMVFGMMKGEEKGEGEIGQPEEAVDYDYPLPSTEVDSQNHMSLADQQVKMLKCWPRSKGLCTLGRLLIRSGILPFIFKFPVAHYTKWLP